MNSTRCSRAFLLTLGICLGCAHQPQVDGAPKTECPGGAVAAAHCAPPHQEPRSVQRDELVGKYRERKDVAIVRVRIDKVEPVSIRRGLVGVVKSEHLIATVVDVVAKGTGFDNSVPRRMLKEKCTIDIINKPGSDRSGGILGTTQDPATAEQQAGVPLGTMVEGRDAVVVLSRPGRNGFLVIDAKVETDK